MYKVFDFYEVVLEKELDEGKESEFVRVACYGYQRAGSLAVDHLRDHEGKRGYDVVSIVKLGEIVSQHDD